MRRALLACLLAATATAAQGQNVQNAQDAWRLERIAVPARVSTVETVGDEVRIQTGAKWYRLHRDGDKVTLAAMQPPRRPPLPNGALHDGRIATGSRDVARAWLAQPTRRYDHGVLGDAIEAGALMIETAEGKRHAVTLGNDAVFEDLAPRIADLDGDGRDEVIVVKSYLARGSALAVIAARDGRYAIAAETPPLGHSHRWLDPAGIADFTGDGKREIALVRQPHVVGSLELWSWQGKTMRKLAVMPDAANHIIGTRAIHMSAVADFDGDGTADLALPSLDRSRLRIVSFAPQAREIASVKLPAKAATNFGLLKDAPAIVVGLSDGSLAIARRAR